MHYDYVFVGGGLASGLCILALLETAPHLRVALVERGPRLGGNHTWCFHARDVRPEARRWIDSLIVQRWPGYEVRFPRRTRRLASPYACVTSQRLHDVLTDRLSRPPNRILLARRARSIEADSVMLEDGEQLRGAMVVDARGPVADESFPEQGYQKFVGLEVEAEPPPSLRLEPVLMDACMAQEDGFRFMYLLPFARDRWLLEETFFSDTKALDRAGAIRRIEDYAKQQGFRIHAVLRSEHGVLPMPWREQDAPAPGGPLRAGYRGGFFHPVTGYSFPLAVRYATALAESQPFPRSPDTALARFAACHREQRRFLLLLTRMMFGLFEPERRFEILEHFYRLPEPVIERFYAADLTTVDRARILLRPPPRGLSWKRALGRSRTLPAEQTP